MHPTLLHELKPEPNAFTKVIRFESPKVTVRLILIKLNEGADGHIWKHPAQVLHGSADHSMG